MHAHLCNQLPSGLFGEPPLDSGGVDVGDHPPNRRANSDIEHHIFAYINAVFGSTFAVQMKCYSKTLDCLKERNRVWGGGGLT